MSNKNTAVPPLEQERLTPKRIITLMIQGAFIGAGGILPGVSGGILCVAFGLYMPLMQLFADPFKEIPRTWKKWMFVGIGGCLGLFIFAFVLDAMLKVSEAMSQSLFAGLIAGTFPSLFREAASDPGKKQDKGNNSTGAAKYAALAIAFITGMSFFIFLALNEGKEIFAIEPNMMWYGVCGFIIGMGFIIPGLTSSSILMFLKLLKPMLEGALAFDFGVIIPVGIGGLLSILLLSKIVNLIFGKWYTTAFYAVIGLVIASTIAIIPREVSGPVEVLICILAAIVGCVGALMLEKALSKYEK